MKNIIFKKTIVFIAITVLLYSCGFFQEELPNIKIECSINKVSVLDKNYCIDSIVLKTYYSENYFFAIKSTSDSLFEVNIGDSNLLLKKYGSFTKCCQGEGLELGIYIRDLRNKEKPLYCGINYKCFQDSVVLTKPFGRI